MTHNVKLEVETASIITISTAHLAESTIRAIEAAKGDLPEGPSIAIREEGFLVNSHLGADNALDLDLSAGLYAPLGERFPDLVLIRALARGLGAEWVNIDRDGVEVSDILPSYDGDTPRPPTGDGWRDALNRIRTNCRGVAMVMPDREVLTLIEAGQTPGLSDEVPSP